MVSRLANPARSLTRALAPVRSSALLATATPSQAAIHTTPLRALSIMHMPTRSLLDDWPFPSLLARPEIHAMRVDLKEEDDKYIIKADVPGCTREHVGVDVDGNVLTIHAERSREDKHEEDKYHRIERHYGKTSRSFTLPTSADSSQITASYKDGVLVVNVAKRVQSKPSKRRIELQE